jgi:hypothetical protein
LEPISLGFLLSGLINGAISTYNAGAGRNQQDRLEESRQDFQIKQHERNRLLQYELLEAGHVNRLKEIEKNFEIACLSAEYKTFLDRWPLITLPTVLRSQQVLPNGTVSLRVIFSRNSDPIFNSIVYPYVELGLRDFVDIYHNDFNSKNIVYLHENFKTSLPLGAVEENMKYALKDIPVLIVDSTVIEDRIQLSATIWGFGDSLGSRKNVFSFPYEKTVEGNTPNKEYYKNIAKKLLIYLKFIIGYSYDAYNLIQYNKAPLLPQVAQHELNQNNGDDCCLLNHDEIVSQFNSTYVNMASVVWGIKSLADSRAYDMHIAKLEYAVSIRGHLGVAEYASLLDESLAVWCSLRSNLSAETFLQSISDNPALVRKYFTAADRLYWFQLQEAYPKQGGSAKIRKLLNDIAGSINASSVEIDRVEVLDVMFLREWHTRNATSEDAASYLLYVVKNRECNFSASILAGIEKIAPDIKQKLDNEDDYIVQLLNESGEISMVRAIIYGGIDRELYNILTESNFFNRGTGIIELNMDV